MIGYPADKVSILTTYNGQKHLIRDVIQQRCADNRLIGRPHKVRQPSLAYRHAGVNLAECCTQPFYGPFSGTTRVSRHQKRTSGPYGARAD